MYPSFTLPAGIPLQPSEMSAAEARRYFEWFVAILPERIKILTSDINAAGRVNWKADGSVESLERVGFWLSENIRSTPSAKIVGPKFDLTSETYVRCFDAGIYFGEVLRSRVEGSRWAVDLKRPQGNPDYGKAVVCGIENQSCEPIRAIVVFAHQLVSGKSIPRGIVQFNDMWAKSLAGIPIVK